MKFLREMLDGFVRVMEAPVFFSLMIGFLVLLAHIDSAAARFFTGADPLKALPGFGGVFPSVEIGVMRFILLLGAAQALPNRFRWWELALKCSVGFAIGLMLTPFAVRMLGWSFQTVYLILTTLGLVVGFAATVTSHDSAAQQTVVMEGQDEASYESMKAAAQQRAQGPQPGLYGRNGQVQQGRAQRQAGTGGWTPLLVLIGLGILGLQFSGGQGRMSSSHGGNANRSASNSASNSTSNSTTSSMSNSTSNIAARPEGYPFNDANATASKEIRSVQRIDYSSSLVLDGRKDTAWNVENKAHGKGEWIELEWPKERAVTGIGVIVGYDKKNYKKQYERQPDMWFRNNRLKAATLLFSNGRSIRVNFDDEKRMQYRDFSPVRANWMRLIVEDIYRDGPDGFDDLAISEIEVWGYD